MCLRLFFVQNWRGQLGCSAKRVANPWKQSGELFVFRELEIQLLLGFLHFQLLDHCPCPQVRCDSCWSQVPWRAWLLAPSCRYLVLFHFVERAEYCGRWRRPSSRCRFVFLLFVLASTTGFLVGWRKITALEDFFELQGALLRSQVTGDSIGDMVGHDRGRAADEIGYDHADLVADFGRHCLSQSSH